jgi:hypothetical protein
MSGNEPRWEVRYRISESDDWSKSEYAEGRHPLRAIETLMGDKLVTGQYQFRDSAKGPEEPWTPAFRGLNGWDPE